MERERERDSHHLFLADEFFHFVLLCFGIGALLVCYHYYSGEACWGPGRGCVGGQESTYNRTMADYCLLAALADWFMSLGVGLLTFASLETIGIYFGLGK